MVKEKQNNRKLGKDRGILKPSWAFIKTIKMYPTALENLTYQSFSSRERAREIEGY
jgi:hypothetical protein